LRVVRHTVRPGAVRHLANGDQLNARAVIAATGQFGAPQVPPLPSMDAYTGELLHVSSYRRPDTYEDRRVVVVGGGGSAIQVAVELAQVADVTLTTRSPLKTRKQRPLGIDLHHWLHCSGVDTLPLGRRAAASVGVLDDGRYTAALAAGRPAHREMFTTFTADGVRWAHAEDECIDAIILATGYRPHLGLLPGQAFEADGWPAHRHGVSTSLPGLGFVGLPGQHGLPSGMIRGVGPDARARRRAAAAPAAPRRDGRSRHHRTSRWLRCPRARRPGWPGLQAAGAASSKALYRQSCSSSRTPLASAHFGDRRGLSMAIIAALGTAALLAPPSRRSARSVSR
jgi:hypothetical protein